MPGPAQTNPEARYWIATIPFGDWTVPEELEEPICWLYGQQEVGAETGYHHWQFVIATKKKIRRNRLKSLLCPSAHLEPTRSESAENYVRKDDTAVPGSQFEKGEKLMKRNSKTDWKLVKDKAVGGNLDEIAENQPQVFIQCYRTLKQIAIDYMNRPDDLTSVSGVWIYGPPGTGKSHFAREHYGRSLYMKAQNKWWCGYQQEENVLLDDLDTNMLGHHLKIWADKYAFMAEAKGSCRLIRPKKFIVTSNYTIEQLFPDPVLAAAISRRFYKIHIPMRMY